jgi:amino acid permease
MGGLIHLILYFIIFLLSFGTALHSGVDNVIMDDPNNLPPMGEDESSDIS